MFLTSAILESALEIIRKEGIYDNKVTQKYEILHGQEMVQVIGKL